MLTPSALVCLPYTPDLIQAGITYACRARVLAYADLDASPLAALRRVVADKAVELAFRRYLEAEGVLYRTIRVTAFTDPERYDVEVGGRRCDLRTFPIFRKAVIPRIQRHPNELLRSLALVPANQIQSPDSSDRDLLVFSFVSGWVAWRSAELKRACQMGQPVFLMYPMSVEWTRPAKWGVLGALTLKLESGPPVVLEVGGQNAQKVFQVERVELSAQKAINLEKSFYSLAYLQVDQLPSGRVGLYSSRLKKTVVIEPAHWGNIWIADMSMILMGCIARSEFRQRAVFFSRGSYVWPQGRANAEYYALPMDALYSVASLVEQVRLWSSR